MRNPDDFVYAMLALIVTTPASVAQEKKGFDVYKADSRISFALFSWREELKGFEKLLLILVQRLSQRPAREK